MQFVQSVPNGANKKRKEQQYTQQAAHANYVDDAINMQDYNNSNSRKPFNGAGNISRQINQQQVSTGTKNGSKTSLDQSYYMF